MNKIYLIGAVSLILVACDRPDHHQPRQSAESSFNHDHIATNTKNRDLMKIAFEDQPKNEKMKTSVDNSLNYFFWGQEDEVQTIEKDFAKKDEKIISLKFTPQIARGITINDAEVTFHERGIYYFSIQSEVDRVYPHYHKIILSFGSVSSTFYPVPREGANHMNLNLVGIIQVTEPNQIFSVTAEAPIGANDAVKYDFRTRSLSIFKISDLN